MARSSLLSRHMRLLLTLSRHVLATITQIAAAWGVARHALTLAGGVLPSRPRRPRP